MIEVLVALVVVVIGVFAIVTAFAGAKAGSSKHPIVRPKAAKPSAGNAAAAKPQKKKENKKAQQRKAEEEEMERLIAADAKSHAGMTTDKQRVVSLEEAMGRTNSSGGGNKGARGEEKSENSGKPSGNRSAPQPVLSAKQRLIEQERGFTVVEKREKRAPQVAQFENDRDIDRDLTTFFRQVDRKGKKDFGGGALKKEPARPQQQQQQQDSNGGYVTMQKKISNDPRTVWKSTEQWATAQE